MSALRRFGGDIRLDAFEQITAMCALRQYVTGSGGPADPEILTRAKTLLDRLRAGGGRTPPCSGAVGASRVNGHGGLDAALENVEANKQLAAARATLAVIRMRLKTSRTSGH